MGINWKTTVGQERIKETFDKAFDDNRIGQSYLFMGETGTGKFSLALEIAMAFLCESDSKPCGICENCYRILRYSHPHFRYLFPLTLATEHKTKGNASKISDNGWEYISTKIVEKINDPYLLHESYSAAIPVEWIRDVNSTIMRGSKEKTVVIIEGIEYFRAESANAMLKTLEEPPENTLILLITRSLHRVLPTVRSRCQINRFTLVRPEETLPWLEQDFSSSHNVQSLNEAVELSNGAPGIARAMIQKNDTTTEELTEKLSGILSQRSSVFEQALSLEQFIENDLSRDFVQAEQILLRLLEKTRKAFLSSYTPSTQYIFDDKTAPISPIKSSYIDLCVEAIENALNSTRKHTSLHMVFTELVLKI